jgi:hypothetical protein
MPGVKSPARLDQVVQRSQAALAVVAQAAGIVVPDVRELWTLLAHLEHLVDLLLVLDHGKRDLGVVDRVDELGRHGVLVQRHRNGPQRLGGEHRGIEAGSVFPHHHQVLAALQAGLGQAAGQVAHHRSQVGPAQGLPDAVFLLAQCGGAGAAGRMLEQELGKGGLHRGLLMEPVTHAGPLHVRDAREMFDAMLSL